MSESRRPFAIWGAAAYAAYLIIRALASLVALPILLKTVLLYFVLPELLLGVLLLISLFMRRPAWRMGCIALYVLSGLHLVGLHLYVSSITVGSFNLGSPSLRMVIHLVIVAYLTYVFGWRKEIKAYFDT